jgi:hypothetical protein
MASGFDLNNFRAEVLSRGIHKTNLFQVMLFPPQTISIGDSRIITLFCDSTTLPDVDFDAIDGHQRFGFGQVESIPFQPIFTPLSCTFLMENFDEIRSFFTAWLNAIVSFNVTDDASSPYEVTYKTDFVGQMTITGLNEQLQPVYTYNIRDCYPTTMGKVHMNWNDQNNLARMAVNFSYKDWFTHPSGVFSDASDPQDLQDRNQITRQPLVSPDSQSTIIEN